ncbi:hypothetical protein RSAG8_00085, partial [Rhizoctonia solani AG-8 WAC10335]
MFGFSTLISTLAVALVASIGVQAERHVVHFDNRCGYGTPTLIQGGRVLSTGGDYVSKADDYQAQRQCQSNDVNLAITFCA